ncbi:ArsR/SmtB family transcription factor [Roseateles koreensis]|uniref:Metalloregulator ArsR/SmtB family transcription factor n=1 Tax=Roseateles koreensis TaxID=2987526 RepID=A0ABT5KR60_9BURK|nr:metalloregulator ArsR/SmtB family transcription factor [Roseateles koreensis]MDC8785337.1 metalloregulator ArsR/SmtB family transcription factor [Roseateles koreensis]
MKDLPAAALVQIAGYFQALAEPTRLQILNLLRQEERRVGDLAELCGFSAANISRHLAVLQQHGLVERESRGTSAYFRIADASVYQLCDLVCGNIARQSDRMVLERAAFFPVQPELQSPSRPQAPRARKSLAKR